jgi:DNA-binding transcriptional ArsR family regulator
MVKYHVENLDAVFSALADPTRRAILERLAGGSLRVTELAAPFEISLPAVSRHLRVLQQAGLIGREVEGRVHHCRLEAAAMKEAADWLSVYRRFWEARLDALADFLAGVQAEESSQPGADAVPPQMETEPDTEGDDGKSEDQ